MNIGENEKGVLPAAYLSIRNEILYNQTKDELWRLLKMKATKTGRLLVGGFALLLVLMAVLAFSAIRESDTLADLTDKIYRHPLTVSNAVLEANAHIIAMHRYMKDVALSKSMGELEVAITQVAEHEAKVYKNFDVIMDRFLGDKTKIVQARQAFTNWKDIRSEVIDLTRNGRLDEAAQITKGKGARHVLLMTSRMDALIDFARNKASEFLIDSKKQKTYSQLLLYSILGVVVIFGGGIAVFVVLRVQKAEAQLLKAKSEAERSNRAKSEFLASMSHDLRTPLNAIIGFSDMMRNKLYGPLGDKRYEEYTEDIHNSGQHLVNMVNDILDLSKIEAERYEIKNARLRIKTILDSAANMIAPLARAKDITLSVVVPEDFPDLWCDERAVTQVFTNLLSNGVKFTDKGGRVTVQARVSEDSSVAIAVSDTGIGMSKEEINLAFEPFYQADSRKTRVRNEGTGLGLYVCHKLVALHDGDMTIISDRGGTVVTVEKVVPKEFIQKYAALVKIPAYAVRAVVPAPMGLHPFSLANPGIDDIDPYEKDVDFLDILYEASESEHALDEWIREWILECDSHEQYLEKLGEKRICYS